MAKKVKKGVSTYVNTKYLNLNVSKWPPLLEINSSLDKDLYATIVKFLK